MSQALGMGLDSDSEGLRAGVGGVHREKKMGISGQEKSTHTYSLKSGTETPCSGEEADAANMAHEGLSFWRREGSRGERPKRGI